MFFSKIIPVVRPIIDCHRSTTEGSRYQRRLNNEMAHRSHDASKNYTQATTFVGTPVSSAISHATDSGSAKIVCSLRISLTSPTMFCVSMIRHLLESLILPSMLRTRIRICILPSRDIRHPCNGARIHYRASRFHPDQDPSSSLFFSYCLL